MVWGGKKGFETCEILKKILVVPTTMLVVHLSSHLSHWVFSGKGLNVLSHVLIAHSLEEISCLQEINVARGQLKILQEESFLGHSPNMGEQL